MAGESFGIHANFTLSFFPAQPRDTRSHTFTSQTGSRDTRALTAENSFSLKIGQRGIAFFRSVPRNGCLAAWRTIKLTLGIAVLARWPWTPCSLDSLAISCWSMLLNVQLLLTCINHICQLYSVPCLYLLHHSHHTHRSCMCH